jgi:hypothetical protein
MSQQQKSSDQSQDEDKKPHSFNRQSHANSVV